MNKQTTGRGAAYRQSTIERAVTEEVKLPSGAVFLLRRPELEVFTMAGTLPLTISARMKRAQESGQSVDAAFASLSVEDQIKTVQFGNRLIRHICVDPKIVDEPTNDDEIGIEDLSRDDLRFLTEWASTIGGAADANQFRPGSNSVAGNNRPKQRNAAK